MRVLSAMETCVGERAGERKMTEVETDGRGACIASSPGSVTAGGRASWEVRRRAKSHPPIRYYNLYNNMSRICHIRQAHRHFSNSFPQCDNGKNIYVPKNIITMAGAGEKKMLN